MLRTVPTVLKPISGNQRDGFIPSHQKLINNQMTPTGKKVTNLWRSTQWVLLGNKKQIGNTRDHRNQLQRHYTSEVWLYAHNPSSWETDPGGLPQVHRLPYIVSLRQAWACIQCEKWFVFYQRWPAHQEPMLCISLPSYKMFIQIFSFPQPQKTFVYTKASLHSHYLIIQSTTSFFPYWPIISRLTGWTPAWGTAKPPSPYIRDKRQRPSWWCVLLTSPVWVMAHPFYKILPSNFCFVQVFLCTIPGIFFSNSHQSLSPRLKHTHIKSY